MLRWAKRTNFVVRLWYGNVPFSDFCRTTKPLFCEKKQAFSLLKHKKSFNNNILFNFLKISQIIETNVATSGCSTNILACSVLRNSFYKFAFLQQCSQNQKSLTHRRTVPHPEP